MHLKEEYDGMLEKYECEDCKEQFLVNMKHRIEYKFLSCPFCGEDAHGIVHSNDDPDYLEELDDVLGCLFPR